MTERRLILMRHAKSSWKQPGLTDHDRPLNGRGRQDAPAMADALVARGWLPDAVVSSTAARTLETWSLMEDRFSPREFLTSELLYLAGLAAIVEHATRWDDGWSTVLVFGHNPGWSVAASRLSGQSVEMTTANCALLVGTGATWSDALKQRWTLKELLRPREPRW